MHRRPKSPCPVAQTSCFVPAYPRAIREHHQTRVTLWARCLLSIPSLSPREGPTISRLTLCTGYCGSQSAQTGLKGIAISRRDCSLWAAFQQHTIPLPGPGPVLSSSTHHAVPTPNTLIYGLRRYGSRRSYNEAAPTVYLSGVCVRPELDHPLRQLC